MGEEADADWQDGLVEWGIEDTREALRRAADEALEAARKRGAKVHPRVAAIKRNRRSI
jgi:hypothetical protein